MKLNLFKNSLALRYQYNPSDYTSISSYEHRLNMIELESHGIQDHLKNIFQCFLSVFGLNINEKNLVPKFCLLSQHFECPTYSTLGNMSCRSVVFPYNNLRSFSCILDLFSTCSLLFLLLFWIYLALVLCHFYCLYKKIWKF
jgi:hypothetical protein